MIKIDYCSEPDFLRSNTVTNALGRIRARVNVGQSPAIEKKDERLWRDARVTDELYRSHKKKCCYCDSCSRTLTIDRLKVDFDAGRSHKNKK